MRIITDSDGRVLDVSFGGIISCGGQDCQEYTGSVPAEYTSLEDWFIKEADKLYRWTVVDGELILDSSAVAPVDLPVADYIAEQGVTDVWNWEKYANGKIHCARRVSTGYTATLKSGNLYYQDYDIVVPDAVPVLTDTINNVIIMPQAGNGLGFFMVRGIRGRTIGYRYVNSASVSNNQLTVLYQFDGKWK